MTQITLVKSVLTCECVPSQWDAWGDDGQYYYIRYRHGHGSITAYKGPDWWKVGSPDYAAGHDYEDFAIADWNDNSNDGCISLSDFVIQTEQFTGVVIAISGVDHAWNDAAHPDELRPR